MDVSFEEHILGMHLPKQDLNDQPEFTNTRSNIFR